MSDGTREFRVVDRDGEGDLLGTFETLAEAREVAADLTRSNPGAEWCPFTVQSRFITDWQPVETEDKL